ncbi:uncharacterized protein LOC142101927 isoform X2 [Mixophyes fleayi]|uniref:uncharacterized protein LOC142101927 isoform X2 n=1 Tax=Mixophyes fleayi TaxID=3061075 RepID=UPI003F4DEDC2
MSLLPCSLLLCLLLKSCITNSISTDSSPPCKALSDFNHQLSQKELEGSWHLYYSSAGLSNEHDIINSWLDLHFTNDDHVQVRQVITLTYFVRIEAHEMQITKEKDSYILTAKDGHKFTIYPVNDHVILYEDEDGIRLFSHSKETSGYTEEDFRHLSQCLGQIKVNVHLTRTPDSEHSDKDCQDYKPISDKFSVAEILGKKMLVLSAYSSKLYSTLDQKIHFVLNNFDIEGETLKGRYVFGDHRSIRKHHATVHLEEENGVATLRDTGNNRSVKVHRVDDNCLALTATAETEKNDTRFLLIYCGPEPVSSEDIQKFVHHAKCQNLSYTIVRKDSAKLAFSCEDSAYELDHITQEQLLGRWHCVASAFRLGLPGDSVGQWVQIDVQDGEVKLTDSFRFHTGIPVKVSEKSLTVITDLADKVTVTLYELGEDYIMTNIHVECNWGKYNTLNLFSKSGNADAKQIERFKLTATCLDLPVIITKQ